MLNKYRKMFSSLLKKGVIVSEGKEFGYDKLGLETNFNGDDISFKVYVRREKRDLGGVTDLSDNSLLEAAKANCIIYLELGEVGYQLGNDKDAVTSLSAILSPIPAPLVKLKPGIVSQYFTKDTQAYKDVKKFYAVQDLLLHDHRRHCANMWMLAALGSKWLVERYMEEDVYLNIAAFVILTAVAAPLFSMPIGELESIYNNKTRGVRESLDQALGETISSYVPHLDTLARLGGAYIASSMLCDEPLVKGAIAIACALQPAVSKYMHDKPYLEQGL